MILPMDDGQTPFCLAGCRNAGVKAAEDAGADVVIINDADTFPQLGPLNNAIEAAYIDRYVHLPYTTYRSLMLAGTQQFLRGKKIEQCSYFVVEGACSGVYVTSPKTWWSHYGQDERFVGWGFEDSAWFSAHITLLGREPVRHAGTIYAMHHESAIKEGKQYEKSADLMFNYLNATTKEQMTALVTGA